MTDRYDGLQPVRFCEVWKQIVTNVQKAIAGIVVLYTEMRRQVLYVRLMGYYIPDSLAWFLAAHCPARWLPQLNLESGKR